MIQFAGLAERDSGLVEKPCRAGALLDLHARVLADDDVGGEALRGHATESAPAGEDGTADVEAQGLRSLGRVDDGDGERLAVGRPGSGHVEREGVAAGVDDGLLAARRVRGFGLGRACPTPPRGGCRSGPGRALKSIPVGLSTACPRAAL